LESLALGLDGLLLEPHPAAVSAQAAARPRMGERVMRRLYRWRDHTNATAGRTEFIKPAA
jgi:hypothetical protein